MDPASVTVQLNPLDLKRFSRFAANNAGTWLSLRTMVVLALVAFGVGFSRSFRVHPQESVPHEHVASAGTSVPWGVAPIALFLVIFWFLLWRAKRPSAYEARSPGVFKLTTYEVTEHGFVSRNERGESVHYWHAILRFAETNEDFYVMLAKQNGHILPKRCFPTLEAMAIFKNQMHLYLEKHAPAALAAKGRDMKAKAGESRE